jgi:rhodanese-related sulfurtransferase
MAKTLLLAAAAVGLLLGQTQSESKVKQLTVDEIKTHVKNNDVLWLDVREPKEVAELGTVKGAVNIPLGQLPGRLGELPKDKTILPMCNHGVRAARAAGLLLKNGYKVAAACGLADYKAQGNPLVYPTPAEKPDKK